MKHNGGWWVGLLVVGFTATALPCLAAQATARVGATIVSGLAITNVRSLEFGVIAPDAGGNVVVSPDGRRTAFGGARLLDSGDTTFSAEFAVKGAAGATYSVALPGSVVITSGSDNMTVSDFSCTAPGSLAGGSTTLRVGATLAVAANQPLGRYEGAFDVVVNYD